MLLGLDGRGVLRDGVFARLEALKHDLERRGDGHRQERADEPAGRCADQDADQDDSGEMPTVFRMTIGTSTLPSTNWRTT